MIKSPENGTFTLTDDERKIIAYALRSTAKNDSAAVEQLMWSGIYSSLIEEVLPRLALMERLASDIEVKQ